MAGRVEPDELSPTSFGFAVAVHPREPATAWFVPGVKDEHRIPAEGKVVVARTRDGGQTYEVLRHGLPQEHAYDLTYRHGLDIDATGDRLAFGTTTGSLWVTRRPRRLLAQRLAAPAAHLLRAVCAMICITEHRRTCPAVTLLVQVLWAA